ncbi:hypothetical protein OCH74_01570 [Bifidobacterium thermacidophilum]|uniref:Uncharacterized protein n=1 Tax=Bifidobacterium thermacidophilum TaxID=246618 RepID=A0ABW8KNQ5_9BIFI
MNTMSTDNHRRQRAGRLFDADEMRAIARKPVVPAPADTERDTGRRGGASGLILRTVARLLHMTIREGE